MTEIISIDREVLNAILRGASAIERELILLGVRAITVKETDVENKNVLVYEFPIENTSYDGTSYEFNNGDIRFIFQLGKNGMKAIQSWNSQKFRITIEGIDKTKEVENAGS